MSDVAYAVVHRTKDGYSAGVYNDLPTALADPLLLKGQPTVGDIAVEVWPNGEPLRLPFTRKGGQR